MKNSFLAKASVPLMFILICAFCTGPIMQAAFASVRFDATAIRHQPLHESLRVFLAR